METKMTTRGPLGQLDEVERRKRKRGLEEIIGTASKATVSKALGDEIVQEHSKALRDKIVQEHEPSCEDDALDDMVLPGIFNDVTMAHIVTKLSWKDLHLLRSVSRTWLHGIRSREVHTARVCYRATNTFIVYSYHCRTRKERYTRISIALYSMTENRTYMLPPVPPFPISCLGTYLPTVVSLDGKVYIMEQYMSNESLSGSNVASRMLMFDVAGQGGWQPCASKQMFMEKFRCGVFNGKIYAFGGGERYGVDGKILVGDKYDTGMSEVFDPKDNTWSWIKRGQALEVSDPEWVMGTKLAVRRSCQSDPVCVLGEKLVMRRKWQKDSGHDYLQMYDPTADEWTELKRSLSVADGLDLIREPGVHKLSKIFTAQGNFYMMDAQKIYIYDSEKETWKYLHALSFNGMKIGPRYTVSLFPRQVLVGGEELVAVVDVFQTADPSKIDGTLVFRSRSRLGGENKEILWQEVRAETDDLIGHSSLTGRLSALNL